MDCKITIFTPTYNRANLLDRLYKSLVNQTNKNFIWLVVDDGSKDNTEEVIQQYISEGKITIKYVYKDNGGKHSAMDLAHSICETEYIAGVDSDDYLLETAVENLYNHILNINDENCVGLVGRKFDVNKNPLGNNWVEENKLIYFNELYGKYNYNADTFLIFKTSIVKNYHFPTIEGERFITEKVLYNQFLYNHKIYAIDTTDYIAEYQSEGYSASSIKLMFNNPKGVFCAFKSDTYYMTKYNAGLKNIVLAWARFYAWRRLNKFKNLFKDEMNIKSYKKFIGWCLSFIMQIRYNKKKKIYLKNN